MRGGGDAGSLLPGVLPPELDACLCGHIDRDMSATHVSEPPPPPPTRHLHSSVAFSRVACCVDVKRAAHGCTRWRRCSAAQGPSGVLVLATRADDRADGTTGTEDRQCSWDAAGASFGGVRAAGSSHGRLRGCPGASPLHTVCSRSCGRPCGEVPPPEDFGPDEGGGGVEERGGEAAGGDARVEDEAAQRQGPPRPAAH